MLETSSVDYNYNTLLDLVYSNNISILRNYLSLGLDPDIKSNKGVPLFNEIVEDEKLDIAQLFLEYGANPEANDDEGKNAVLISINKGNIELLNLFIKYGIKITNFYDKRGSNALMIAVWHNYEALVNELLKFDFNINEMNHNNITALGYAACINNFNLVNILLKHGANIDGLNKGETLLNILSEQSGNYIDMIKFLILKGANYTLIRWNQVNSLIKEELKIFVENIELKEKLEEDEGSSEGSSTGGKKIIKI